MSEKRYSRLDYVCAFLTKQSEKLLSKYSENELWGMLAKKPNKEIRDCLFGKYYALVLHIAKKYHLFYSSKFEMEDIVGYGCMGLLHAIDGFDAKRGISFMSFAYPSIRGYILTKTASTKPNNVPIYVDERSKELDKTMDELEAFFGREPTEREIAKKLNMRVREYRDYYNLFYVKPVASLDSTLRSSGADGEDVFSYHEVVESSSYQAMVEALDNLDIQEILEQEIGRLKPREQEILRGLMGKKSYRKIAESLGVSHQAVAHRSQRIFEKLRKRVKIANLAKDYL